MLSVFPNQFGGFKTENKACLTLLAKTLCSHEAKITRSILLVSCTLCLTKMSHGLKKNLN